MPKTTNKRGESKRVGKVLNLLARREPKCAVLSYNTTPATAGSVSLVSNIAQGDGLGDRSGDKIFLENMDVGVNVLATATVNIRYIVVRDKFSMGTVPAVTDILSATSVASPYNSLNTTQQKRFRILVDKVLSFSVNGTLARTFYKRNIPVQAPCFYTGANGTDEAAGAIYLLVISDVATAASHDMRFKLVYSDY